MLNSSSESFCKFNIIDGQSFRHLNPQLEDVYKRQLNICASVGNAKVSAGSIREEGPLYPESGNIPSVILNISCLLYTSWEA